MLLVFWRTMILGRHSFGLALWAVFVTLLPVYALLAGCLQPGPASPTAVVSPLSTNIPPAYQPPTRTIQPSPLPVTPRPVETATPVPPVETPAPLPSPTRQPATSTPVAGQTSAPQPPPASPTGDGSVPTNPFAVMIQYNAKTDKDVYRLGEVVRITFTITNKPNKPVTFLNLPPALVIRGRHVPVEQRTPAGSQAVTLAPGEGYTCQIEWDQRVTSGIGQSAEPGIYRLEPGSGLQIERGGYASWEQLPSGFTTFVIQHPEGETEQRLFPNRTVMANGIPITLESIEMTALEMKITVVARQPDYVYRQDWFTLPESYRFYASGRYKLDDGKFILLPTPRMRAGEVGWLNVWPGLDPVGRGANALTLVIDSFDGMKGPWVFEVPLAR